MSFNEPHPILQCTWDKGSEDIQGASGQGEGESNPLPLTRDKAGVLAPLPEASPREKSILGHFSM